MQKLIFQTTDGYKFEWVQMSDTYGQWHELDVEETDLYFEGTVSGPVDMDGELIPGDFLTTSEQIIGGSKS